MKFFLLSRLFKKPDAIGNTNDLIKELREIKAKLPKQDHLLMEDQIAVFNLAMRKGITIDAEVFQAYGDTMEAKALENYKSLPEKEKEKIDRRNRNAQGIDELSMKFKTVDAYVARNGTIIGYPYGAKLRHKP